MSATRTVAHTRSCSTAEDHKGPNLDEILNTNRNKNKADQKAKRTGQKSTDNQSTGGGSRDAAIILGVVAWDNMFQEGSIKLPGTISWIDLKKN